MINVMKARFQGMMIEAKGGFLDHFDKNFFQYIAKPFREDAICTILYESMNEREWLVIDKVQYVCRRVGPRIQEKIVWCAEEADELLSVRVEVGIPFEEGHYVKKTIFSYPDVDTSPRPLSDGINLDEFKEMDGLKVNVTAQYTQKKGRHSAWYMVMPT